MRYFVIADGGQRYGPADVQTLNMWVSEGRILPGTHLQPETGGAVIAASLVPGLSFQNTPSLYAPPPPHSGTPPGFANYPRGAGGYALDDGRKDANNAIAAGVASIVLSLLCFFGLALGIVGMQLGYRAKQKGNPNGVLGMVLSGVGLCAWIFVRIIGHRFFRF